MSNKPAAKPAKNTFTFLVAVEVEYEKSDGIPSLHALKQIVSDIGPTNLGSGTYGRNGAKIKVKRRKITPKMVHTAITNDGRDYR